ncbi:MAG: SIMPL domain-containing protein, partial [Halieaceae bacterium]
MTRFTTLFSLAILASLAFINTAGADDMRPTVSVTGEGVVTAAPDMAMVSTGVTTEAATPEAALNANTAAMASLMNVLDDLDIANKDRQTSNFNVSPQYRRDRNETGGPRIDGYRVSNQLTIRVRDLGELGTLLDALVKAGSNQLGNIRFDFSERGKLVD